jgi:uncharacterized protein (DUF983 family)
MSIKEKFIHGFIISILLSVVNWFIINKFIINIPLWKYFILELIFVVSMKLYKFTLQKLQLQ